MRALVDTNVLVRHLTGDPPDMAARSTSFLGSADELLLPDLILVEVVYVLESYYQVPRADIARYARSIIAFRGVLVEDEALLLRAMEIYELDRIDFAEAYLVACAEVVGGADIASFDRSIDRVGTVKRVEPN